MYLLNTYNYYIWAEFAMCRVCMCRVCMGRVCYVPSLLWAEFVMCRVDPTPLSLVQCKHIFLPLTMGLGYN